MQQLQHAPPRPRHEDRCADSATRFAGHTLSYEVTGPPTAPVVVALGGISANRHVTSTIADVSPGWWEALVGAERAINTDLYRVVSFDYADPGATHSGHPSGLVSTHDQADILAQVLDTLGISRVLCIVGASYGGMVALAFAERYPLRVTRLIIISASHRPHPMTTALRSIQRRIVTLGLETGRSHDALALARALAMTTYRTASEFADRFSTAPEATTPTSATFPVERYLLHTGETFAKRWQSSRFLALSISADLHQVDPRRINTPTVLVSINSDTVIPPAQMEELADELAGPSHLIQLNARTGHDAFLAEPTIVGPVLRNSLTAENIS